jgi:hypothetical protein
VQTVGYFSMAFLLAVLLQRTAVSIIVFILVLLINLFIPGMVGDVIATYLPVSVISDLTPVPFRDEFYALQLSQGAILEIPELMAQEIRTTIATAYIILFGVIGFIVLKKRDL